MFELHKTYNFSTRAPAILGAAFKEALVLGILDYTTALNYISPETSNINIFPYLPPGTPSDPKKYTYILFKGQSGNKTVLALEWIDESTVVVVTQVTISITVFEASVDDVSHIRDSLTLLNLSKFVIEVKTQT